MEYSFGNILNVIKEGLNSQLVITNETKPNSSIFIHGFGLEFIPAIILERFNNKIKANNNEEIDYKTKENDLLILLSHQDTIDNHDIYRNAIRKHLKITVIGNSEKLKKLCKINNNNYFEIPVNIKEELIPLYETIILLKAIIESNILLLEETEQESYKMVLSNLCNLISRVDFNYIIDKLTKKTINKKIAIITTTKAKNLALTWKILLNRFANKEILYDTFPNFIYYNLNLVEKNNSLLFFIDDEDTNTIKRKIKKIRELIELPSTEILIKGTNRLYKIIFSLILGMLISFETLAKENKVSELNELLKDNKLNEIKENLRY